MIGKHFTETSNKVKLRINRVRINRARPVFERCFNDKRNIDEHYIYLRHLRWTLRPGSHHCCIRLLSSGCKVIFAQSLKTTEN